MRISRPNVAFIYSRLFQIWRARRFQQFVRLLAPTAQEAILDIGGYPQTWISHKPVGRSVTCLNLHAFDWDSSASPAHEIHLVVGDALCLPYPDKSFEVVFSNSVIEHVGSWEEQQVFAREVQRVGKKYWIQTPAFECPFEPHYLGLFVHWLPASIRPFIVRYFTLWSWLARPTPDQLDEMSRTIRLIRRKEMKALFPGARIVTERLFGIFTKSYIAVKGEPDI